MSADVKAGRLLSVNVGLPQDVTCYAPDPVDEPAEGATLICCSRPREDLVLDL